MRKPILLFIALIAFSPVYAQLSVNVESGLAFQGYNDVRIPNDKQTSTTFSFSEDFDLQGPVVPLRVTIGYTFAEKNHIIGLYAPLAINYESSIPFDIDFQGTRFPEGQSVDGYYKFNSYRLTYRRDVLTTEKWTLGVGFTAKIRDARVRLSTNDLWAKKDDLGFVPLLRIFAAYDFGGWSAYLNGDGLAGGPGRAFDFFLGGKVPLSDNFSVKAGYRILEGGADVDEVYNFTLIHFASVGLGWEF